MKAEQTPKLPTVAFEAESGQYKEKSKDWYWVLWIFLLAIAGAAALLGNYTFSLLIIASAFVLSLLAAQKPQIIPIQFDNSFVKIGSKRYKVSEIEAYHFLPQENRVLLRHIKKYMPVTVVPVGTRPPEGALRSYLNESPWIEDEELQEPFLEILLEKIGI